MVLECNYWYMNHARDYYQWWADNVAHGHRSHDIYQENREYRMSYVVTLGGLDFRLPNIPSPRFSYRVQEVVQVSVKQTGIC